MSESLTPSPTAARSACPHRPSQSRTAKDPVVTDLLTRTLDQRTEDLLGTPGVATPELAGTVAEHLAVVVAPSTGRFRPAADLGTARIAAGELVGHITGGRGRADEVRSPVDAAHGDLLARPGQLVAKGAGLLWMVRHGRPAEVVAA